MASKIRSGDGRDHLKRFLSALRQTPIPTSPPPHDAYQEALGLNLLALALRLEHIDRMSETLTLADSTHMARSVSIDINMNVLTPDQKRALRSDPSSTQPVPAAVWLPVARQSRTDLAPVVVRDAAGSVVPRTTQVETAQALIHGMTKAFRMFLTSDPRTEDPDELLHQIRYGLNRSRWLIEATIANMIGGGGRHPTPVPIHTDRGRATDSDSIRDKATRAIEELFAADSPFLRLLDIASSEYLLVVEVPTDKPQSFLRYDAPVMPARSRDLRGRATIARGAIFKNEFTVRYRTIIPRAVNSYHVTLEVPPAIQVRRFFLTSDVDAPALRSLVNDMHAVSESYDELRAVSPKLLELELQGIASRLAEFGRRRYRDLESFMSYIEACYATFSRRRPRFPSRTETTGPVEPERSLHADLPLVTRLANFSHLYETDHFRKLADGLVSPAVLDSLADELSNSELDKDIYVDNDPRENAGHAHWQRRPFGIEPQPVEPVESTVYIELVDDPPSLASNVSKLLLAVLLVVIGFGVVLVPRLFENVPLLGEIGEKLLPPDQADQTDQANTPESGPLSSADAVVTILLLGYGLIISRLDAPQRKSVLGRLRLFPLYVAYASVVVAVFLALCVASLRSDLLEEPFVVTIIALLVLFILVSADSLTKVVRRRSRVPSNQASPSWLIAELRRGRPDRPPKRCSANFSTIGGDDA